MGKAKLLCEREKSKIYSYLLLQLSKREISQRMRRSVHAITTYIANQSSYGKNYRGRTTKYDDRRLRSKLG